VDIPQIVDGKSLFPYFKMIQSEINRPLFWHYPNEWGSNGPGIGSFSAVRQGDWKLIYFHTNKTLELYNLNDDIGENQNLLAQIERK